MANNAVSSDLEQQLFEEALKDGDITKIKQLISNGFYVNQTIRDLPLLSFALSNGRFEVAELLISLGADVCQLDDSGKYSPMFFAIKHGCPKTIIRRLILARAPITGIVEYNFRSTALHLAAFGNRKSVIKCLLGLSTDVNSKNISEAVNNKDINGMTPLHVAVQANHPKIVKMLVHKGAKLDAECKDKFTPLMLAIRDNNLNLVELLISLGSDVNYEPEKPKYTYQKPLNYAAGLGHVEIMQLLLNQGADAKSSTIFYDSPLHSMAYSDKLTDKSVIQVATHVIIEHGADLNCYNNLGQNPLHSSIIVKNTIVANALVKAGSSVSNPTRDEDTPLHLAAVVGDSSIVELLLAAGADMNVKNSFGLTPYDLALKQADTNTVRIFWSYGQLFDDSLLESGKEINESILSLIKQQKRFFSALELGLYDQLVDALEKGAEAKGCSLHMKYPLHHAVSHHHVKLVAELLKRGVPVVRSDNNGETVLHLVSKSDDLVLCMQLLAYGACYNSLARCRKTPCQMAKDSQNLEVMNLLLSIDFLFCMLVKENIEELTKFSNTLTNFLEEMMMTIRDRGDECSSFASNIFLNCVNSEGHTLLSKAMSIGFDEGVKIIMSYRLKNKS